MINIIVQFRQDLLTQLRNIKADSEADIFGILPALRAMMDFDREWEWWLDQGNGMNRFVVVDMIVTEEQLDQLLNLPGANTRINILRALNQDGTEYGGEDPVYPDQTGTVLGFRYLYDKDGNQIGTQQLSFAEHPQWLGWKRYD